MIQIVTPSNAAAVLPVATLKQHLRIDHADEDALIGIYASAAVRAVEARTGRNLAPATYTLSLPYVPDVIDIGVANVTAITALKIVDADGEEHTIGAGDILLHTGEFGSTVEPAPGAVWPAAGAAWNACEITFTAGYASVPADITAALLLTATALHRGRGDAEIPRGAVSLISPYITGGWR